MKSERRPTTARRPAAGKPAIPGADDDQREAYADDTDLGIDYDPADRDLYADEDTHVDYVYEEPDAQPQGQYDQGAEWLPDEGAGDWQEPASYDDDGRPTIDDLGRPTIDDMGRPTIDDLDFVRKR